MELKEALLKRRSVRDFVDGDIADELLDELMYAAMAGPSAMNSQPWEFYVVKNKNILKQLRESGRHSNMNAGAAIVVTGNKKRFLLGREDFWIEDCSAATENILLRACDLGLGTVWCGVYPVAANMENIKNILKLNENEIPFALIFVGEPKINPEPRTQYDSKKIHYLK